MAMSKMEGFVEVGPLSLSYASFGKPSARPLLLIMGLAMQRTSWPKSWIEALVAQNYRVITFDNRDVGLSTRFDQAFTPTPLQLVMRRMFGYGQLAYDLSTMADDTCGLLDALKIEQASVLGVSMGGMIAQRLALQHPKRVNSLSLVMTSSGNPSLPLPRLDVLRFMAKRPDPKVEPKQAAVEYLSGLFALIGSPGYRVDAVELRARAALQAERSLAGSGMIRQLAAIQADTARCQQLSKLNLPVQVLHGDSDPLLPVAHGQDLADRIVGATLRIIPGLGHDLPDGLAEFFAHRVAELDARR